MSAITIPQMAALVREHGYVPVGVDIDVETLSCDPAAVRRAVTPRTRALVLAALFGARPDVVELARTCRAAGLMFIEDRAQAFSGAAEPLGVPDVAMYSFPIGETPRV